MLVVGYKIRDFCFLWDVVDVGIFFVSLCYWFFDINWFFGFYGYDGISGVWRGWSGYVYGIYFWIVY